MIVGYGVYTRSRYHKLSQHTAKCSRMDLAFLFESEEELKSFANTRHSITLTRCPKCWNSENVVGWADNI